MFKFNLIVFSLIYLTNQVYSYSATADWFERAKLDKLVKHVPKYKLYTLYGDRIANLGNVFEPTEVRFQPYVWWDAYPEKHYTLMMVDPDGGEYGHINHWLVVNIKGSKLNTGDVIRDYMGAAPPKGTSYHRYVFLVYKQKKKIDIKHLKMSHSRSTDGRIKFDLDHLTKHFELGKPIYGNYFYAKYDSFVDKFYASLMD